MKQVTIGLVAGPFRHRARCAVESLLGQTMADEIQIHVVDFEPDAESIATERAGLTVTRAPADWLIGSRQLRVVADAKLQHAGLKHYVDVLEGVYHYERAAHGWARDRGATTGPVAIAKVALSPLVRTLKTLVAETRISRFPFVTLGLFPLAVLLHSAAATGQIVGRMKGAGTSAASYSRNELVTARTALPPLEAG